MQSDGRIRSKDIGTGEVNSRIVSDLYSDTYDGSKEDPEAQPGTSGWILLKNGLAVFNQAIIRGTITAAEIIGGFLRGGELNIREGGRITVGGDPTAVPPVNPLVVIDESGVDVGGGLTKITSSGVDIGSGTVVLDGDGLTIGGGTARALDLVIQKDINSSATLTTTSAEKAFTEIAVPAWALKAQVQAYASTQAGNGGTSTYGIEISARVDGINLGGGQHDVAVGETARTTVFNHTELSGGSLGSTIRVANWSRRNGGSQNQSASAVVMGTILFTR